MPELSVRLIRILAGGLATAGAMGVVGWGLPGVAMAGPAAGRRITTLVPQIEVTVVFLVGVPVWARVLRAQGFEALRHALVATAWGTERAIGSAVASGFRIAGEAAAGGVALWVLAGFLERGPSLRHVLTTRLLLLAFVGFGLGLGSWTSTLWRGASWASSGSLAVVLAMAAVPLAAAPVISLFGAQPPLIRASMLLSPWIVMAGVSGFDILRTQWVYTLSPLGSLEAPYPSLGLAAGTYALAGVLLLGLSVRALRTPRTPGGGRG